MHQIREGIFETNSSSTHVLSVTAKHMNELKIPETVYVDEDVEFGWENETYDDVSSKLSYLYILCDYYKNGDQNTKESPNWIRICALLEVIGVKNIKYDKDEDNKWGGYIDHGNEAYGFLEELLKMPDLLYSFLFSDSSFIETGNDNDDVLRDKYIDDDDYDFDPKKIPGDYVYIKNN